MVRFFSIALIGGVQANEQAELVLSPGYVIRSALLECRPTQPKGL
jgi:hypothetical protein